MARKKAPQESTYDREVAVEVANAAANDEALYVNVDEARKLELVMSNGQPCFEVDYSDLNKEDPTQVLVSGTDASILAFTNHTIPAAPATPDFSVNQLTIT